jgi:hypothetical protein
MTVEALDGANEFFSHECEKLMKPLTPSERAVLPCDATPYEVRDVSGWLYPVIDPYGDKYTMFLWHDGISVQVSLVDPPLEQLLSGPEARIGADAKLDPLQTGGFPSTLAAFQGSVLWVVHWAIRTRTDPQGGDSDTGSEACS